MWKSLFYLSALAFTLIVLATYLNILPFQQFTQQYDKLLHFLLFGGVSWLGFRAFPKQYNFQSFLIPAFPFWMTLFSIAEELFQQFYPHRTFSFLDLLANFCGIWLFYLADRLFYYIRKRAVQDN
ncbi:MAG: VanZ family protein [Arenicella sp.]|jgi:VanZ family protein